MKKILSGLLVLSLAVLVGCVASGPPPAVGVWDATVNSPQGSLAVVLTMNADGSGEMTANMFGSTPISDIAYADNTTAFTATISVQGQQVVLDFTGAVEGDTLSGVFDSSYGPSDVTATRQ
tara:strand:- start:56382 stop:56744 length:363 start_codon:yes stop_codon:yes gene_type:complete